MLEARRRTDPIDAAYNKALTGMQKAIEASRTFRDSTGSVMKGLVVEFAKSAVKQKREIPSTVTIIRFFPYFPNDDRVHIVEFTPETGSLALFEQQEKITKQTPKGKKSTHHLTPQEIAESRVLV